MLMVELDVKISAGDLYDYNLKHVFGKISGIAAESLGAFGIGYGIVTKNWMMVGIGILLLIYLPVDLWLKTKQASLSPVFKQPLHYLLDDNGLTISQGEQTTTQGWDTMVKAISTSRSIILYTTPVNATIFPRSQMGDKTALVIRCISEHLPPEKVRIKA